MLYGCMIGEGLLIGIQVVVFNCVVIGKNCLVGVGVIVIEGKVFEDGIFILGVFVKVVCKLMEDDIVKMYLNIEMYVV